MTPFALVVLNEMIDLILKFIIIETVHIYRRLKFPIIPRPISCKHSLSVTRPLWHGSILIGSTLAGGGRCWAFRLGVGLGIELDIRLHLAKHTCFTTRSTSFIMRINRFTLRST